MSDVQFPAYAQVRTLFRKRKGIQKVETAVSLHKTEQYLMKIAASSTDQFSSSAGPVVAQQ